MSLSKEQIGQIQQLYNQKSGRGSIPQTSSDVQYNFIEIFNRDQGFKNKMKKLRKSLKNKQMIPARETSLPKQAMDMIVQIKQKTIVNQTQEKTEVENHIPTKESQGNKALYNFKQYLNGSSTASKFQSIQCRKLSTPFLEYQKKQKQAKNNDFLNPHIHYEIYNGYLSKQLPSNYFDTQQPFQREWTASKAFRSISNQRGDKTKDSVSRVNSTSQKSFIMQPNYSISKNCVNYNNYYQTNSKKQCTPTKNSKDIENLIAEYSYSYSPHKVKSSQNTRNVQIHSQRVSPKKIGKIYPATQLRHQQFDQRVTKKIIPLQFQCQFIKQ